MASAALLRALAVVPSQAIPDTVDAFLLATATPQTNLLSFLIGEISQLIKESSTLNYVKGAKDDFIIALLLSISHLVKLSDNVELLLPSILWGVCIPLLQKPRVFTGAFQNIASEMLAEMLISKNAWKYANDSLVPYLLSSLEVILMREQGSKMDASQIENVSSTDFADEGRLEPLKFHIVCGVVATLLAKVSTFMDMKPLKKEGTSKSMLESFCVDLLFKFFHPLLSVISQTGNDKERQSAIEVFLPPVLRIIEKLKEDMLQEFVEPLQKDLWNNLKLLFTQGRLQKQDAFTALDISVNFLLFIFTKEQNVEKPVQVFDLRDEMEFWEVVKLGLVDEDPLTRKRAVHILKDASKAGFMCQSSLTQKSMGWKGLKNISSPLTKRDNYAALEAESLGVWDVQTELWKAFFLLYDMLEEYGTHLVEAAWNHQISLLLPVLCGINSKTEVYNEPGSKQKYHLQNLDACVWWITVLWEKGFKHDNPQVRRLILQSFVTLEWTKIANLADIIPEEFVLGPLLSTLNDAIHHKDFGAKGFYASEMAKAAAKFYGLYSKSLETNNCMNFVIKMAQDLHLRALCRPGFMTLVMCLEASASPQNFRLLDGNGPSTFADTRLGGSGRDIINIQSNTTCLLKSRGIEVVDSLGLLVEESKSHFNPRYRLKVCYHLLKAAMSIVDFPELPFTKIFWFLSLFPQDFISYKGLLHEHVREWLSSATNRAFNSQTWMTKGLRDIVDTFVKPSKCGADVVTDGEIDAWTQEAEKWARVISLGFLEPKNLSSLMMCVHDHACQIYQRAYNSACVPEKLLILLKSIVRLCSLPLQDITELALCKSLLKGMEKHLKLSAPTLIGTSPLDIMRLHLQSILTLNMSEFHAHAERVASIFWSFDLACGVALPNSVIGQLGGPSQRRLPMSIASSILKAVVAISTFADCISWSSENLSGNVSEAAVLFVWEFSWKAVKSKEATKEIEGEIQLSMYEALTSVFKALSVCVSPHVLSIVNQSAMFGGTHDAKALDMLVWSFLDHVNYLLRGRILARNRQAVLLQQKWCCMDSLLSVSMQRVRCIDSSISSNTPALSDVILKAVLFDGISSLESASEDSLLPLLRCIRWLMHWEILRRLVVIDTSNQSNEGLEIVWSLVRSAWAAIADSNKRRVASVAAFLSAIIHPKIFEEPSMHYSNGDAGPLKWILGKLFDQGSRSPRTMRLTAMHVAGLWFKYPAITEYYTEEFKMLSLHGGESIDEELDGQISENPLVAREYLTLMQSLDPELIEEFRNSELYVRVTMAVLIDKLAEVAENEWFQGESNSGLVMASAANCGKKFIRHLLNSLAYDKDLSKELYKRKSAIHRRKTRAWQMMCILSRFVDKEMTVEVMDLLQLCLSKNNLPSVRQYAEIFGIQLCLKYPYLIKERFVPALSDYNMKTQALASYVFISVNVLKHAAPMSLQTELVADILPAVMPYFTTHHHPLRSFSQILMYEVLHKMSKFSGDLIDCKDSPYSLEKKCLQSIVLYLDENIECRRIRVAVEKFMRTFDPSTAATAKGIFSIHQGGEEDPSKPLDDIPFECAPIALMDEVSYFLNEAREDLRQSMTADAISLQREEMYDNIKWEDEINQPRTSLDGPSDFQRKIGSLRFSETPFTDVKAKSLALSESFSMLSVIDREEELLQTTIHTRIEDLVKMRGNRQDLIVVATLLGRIPNLAGLVRTCEVFKASTLILADASVLQDRQFQLISVTAEMWVPIKEVPELSLQGFLEVKMKEGFTIVGLEQTAHSVSLEKYTFPKKTVLVLGREKEGIPINIIQMLHACVEIPQLGVIRSLNVHVSGAIAIWEYTRQFLGN